MLRESFRAVRLMEEYVAGEDLVVLLGPVPEPLRVLLAGRPAQSADRRVDDPSVGVKRQQKPRPPSRAEPVAHLCRACGEPVSFPPQPDMGVSARLADAPLNVPAVARAALTAI